MDHTVENYAKEKKKIKRKLLLGAFASVVVLIFMLIGFSRAWFVSQANIETLVTVVPPDPISIRGANGGALSLDMSYNKDDVTTNADGTKTVTVKRVFSVCSDQPKHKLEIVHTTNLKGLTFKVYTATEDENGSISENGYKYSYNASPLSGEYINGTGVSTTQNYGVADDSKHKQNFENYPKANVQTHAEPLYWKLTDTFDGKENTNQDIDRKYVNYYILEISWTETTKESDIFYVLATDA